MHLDLRKYAASREIERVAQALDVRFQGETEVRKRRSIGAQTNRQARVVLDRVVDRHLRRIRRAVASGRGRVRTGGSGQVSRVRPGDP